MKITIKLWKKPKDIICMITGYLLHDKSEIILFESIFIREPWQDKQTPDLTVLSIHSLTH